MSVALTRRLTAAAACLATAAAMCTALAMPAAANPTGTGVVINEVYGGGGNSGATYTNDFIELYNPTDASISVAGWSVQYASGSSSSTQGFNAVTALSGSIAAHGYYLIQEYAPTNPAGGALPTAQVSGTINMSASTGSVLLATTTDAVGTQCTVDHTANSDSGCAAGLPVAVDLVGYGSTAGHYEGAGQAPGPSGNATSIARTGGKDTNNNSADFTAGAPTPGYSAGTSTVTVANPGTQHATVGTAIDPLTLSASSGTAPYTWTATGLPAGLQVSTGGVISGTPTTPGDASVTVTATDTTGAAGSATFGVDVAPLPVAVTIAQINGTGTSPYDGLPVITRGVVTAAYPAGGFDGFYVQTGGSGGTPDQDQTPGASDAVFVFGSQSAGDVSIGESVQVTGTVSEYKGMTEITFPTVTELATALPAVIPGQIPWSDLQSDAQKQAHAGELMAPQGDFTVTDNYDANYYGSFTLAAGKTPLRQPTDAGTAGSEQAQETAADNAQRTITLDDGSSWNYAVFGSHTADPLPWLTTSNPVRIGSAVTFHEPVILEYRFGLWDFQPTQQVTDNGSAVATFSDTRAENEQPADVGGGIRLATFNVENYFPTTGEDYVAAGLGTCSYYTDRQGNRITVNTCTGTGGSPGPRGAADQVNFQRQQSKIVTGINRLGASIVSLEEIENSVKFGEPRDTALAGLVDALNSAAGYAKWAYVPSPPAAGLPPVAEQDVIRTAFIYQPATVRPVGVSHVLADDSGPGQAFSIAREPLAQEFVKAGAPDSYGFLAVANHLKSKGSDANGLFDDCPSGGDTENTNPANDQGAFNCTRVHQVHDMMAFASAVAQGVGTDKIFLLGDFNAYTHEDPLQEMYAAGYTDLGSGFDPSESTYSFGGLEGSLDHVLANAAALPMVTGADVWQINAQEAVAFAYSRFNYNITQLFNDSEPFAASDHDPVVVGLNLPQAPGWNAKTVYHAGDQVTYQGSTWQALWWTQNQRPGSPYGAWEQLVYATDGTAVWTASRVFNGGDVVTYQGKKYVAKWWTRNQPPGQPYGPWRLAG